MRVAGKKLSPTVHFNAHLAGFICFNTISLSSMQLVETLAKLNSYPSINLPDDLIESERGLQ